MVCRRAPWVHVLRAGPGMHSLQNRPSLASGQDYPTRVKNWVKDTRRCAARLAMASIIPREENKEERP